MVTKKSDETKYYRAEYWDPDNPDSKCPGIPFAGKDMLDAHEYAKHHAPDGMQLFDLQEFELPGDAMTY